MRMVAEVGARTLAEVVVGVRTQVVGLARRTVEGRVGRQAQVQVVAGKTVVALAATKVEVVVVKQAAGEPQPASALW